MHTIYFLFWKITEEKIKQNQLGFFGKKQKNKKEHYKLTQVIFLFVTKTGQRNVIWEKKQKQNVEI